MKRHIFSVISIITLLSTLCMTALAVEIPDPERKGSISVTMTYEEEAVPGGTLTLYRVAEIQVDNGGDYSFRYTAEYENCGISLEDVEDAKTARDMAEYTAERDISGTKVTIGEDRKAVFPDLELGLYLLVQEEAAEGYEKANPFLICVPRVEGDSYLYDVDASPKLELEPGPTPTTPSTGPSSPPDIPQTGMNQAAIPILGASGLVLLGMGWYVAASGKRRANR